MKNNYKLNDIFIEDYKNYRNIEDDIRNNKFIYLKNKREYLNYNISSISDIIIISANNNEYLKKCNKPISILKQYNLKKYEELKKSMSLINKITNSKIIIIGNYCSNFNEEISEYLNNLYSMYNYINMYEIYNKNKDNNFEYKLYLEINKLLK